MEQGQTRARAEEQRLREVIERAHRGVPPVPLSDDFLFVSGDYPRPLRGRAAFEEAGAARRAAQRNFSQSFAMERLVVAEAGDLAYESGTRRQAWETPAGAHHTVDAAYLAVWRQHAGEWRIEAVVEHPITPGT